MTREDLMSLEYSKMTSGSVCLLSVISKEKVWKVVTFLRPPTACALVVSFAETCLSGFECSGTDLRTRAIPIDWRALVVQVPPKGGRLFSYAASTIIQPSQDQDSTSPIEESNVTWLKVRSLSQADWLDNLTMSATTSTIPTPDPTSADWSIYLDT
jgi:hypothetical protein